MEEKPELPVSEQETQIQPPSFLNKIKIHKFKILGGILGVLVFAGAVFGAYKLGQRQAQPEIVERPTPTSFITSLPTPTLAPTPTPIPEVSPTPAPDPTANWKTYTNSKYGFSIKYPNEVNLDESNGYVIFSLWGPTQKAETEFYDGISLLFSSGSLGGKTLKELVDEKVNQSKEVGEILISPTITTIAGTTAYTYRARGLGEHTYFYVSNKPGVYIEIINPTADPTGKGFQRTVDLMLSTFRFLE